LRSGLDFAEHPQKIAAPDFGNLLSSYPRRSNSPRHVGRFALILEPENTGVIEVGAYAYVVDADALDDVVGKIRRRPA
jgi:hypothetical protein